MNRGVKVLQTSALPLGYGAILNCMPLIRILFGALVCRSEAKFVDNYRNFKYNNIQLKVSEGGAEWRIKPKSYRLRNRPN